MAARRPRRSPLPLGAAALLVALAATPLWGDLATLARSWRLSYAEKRELLALQLPVARIAELLGRRLAPDAPVALGRGLRGEFATQRLTEALYPRVVSPEAQAVLELEGGEPVLRGAPEGGFASVPELRESFALEPAPLLLAAFAWCASGLLLVAIARALVPRAPLPWRAAPLVALGALGGLASAGTWLELPVVTRSALLGAAASGGVALWWRWSSLRPALATLARSPSPEALGLAALVALVAARIALLPVSGWDGRSIWLFHARQLFFHGYLPRADLLRVELAFSHPEYPLALPALLAAFAVPSPLWNERLAAAGLAVLLAVIAWLLFSCGRGPLGARAAAVVTACYLLGTAGLSANAYADGFLAGLLAIQYLGAASSDPGSRRLAGAAALCASLVKLEGLVFSACIAASALAARRARARSWLGALALYLPALAQLAFARALDLRSDFRGIRFGELAAAPLERALEVAGALARAFLEPGYDRCDGLVWLGAGALLAVAVRSWRDETARAALPALLVPVLAISAAIAAIFFVTPLDLAWHVGYAFDRLAISPAALALVAAAAAGSSGRGG
jgi:hypothetical protein